MTNKLPARALFYAIIVSLFVALISSAMLLSSYHQHILLGHYQQKERLIYNCESGVALALGAQQDSIAPITIDLFGQQSDSVRIEQRPWGLLDVVSVQSWLGQGNRKDSIVQSFFVGKQPPAYALTLSEGTEPLYVCGNTHIVGDAFLPREGVERGFIHRVSGKPYFREKLIFGKKEIVKRVSNLHLKARFEQLDALKNVTTNFLVEGDSIVQPFHQPTRVLVEDQWDIHHGVLKGNVLVVGTQKVVIGASAILEDVLILAPEITIESGVQGHFQAFAWDSLRVEANVRLHYPSVLGLLPYQERTTFSPSLTIEEGSEVTGIVIAPSFQYNTYKTKITIEQNALVKGQVWVNGLLQHKGGVYGSVFCDEFLLQTPAAVYENYLLDAIINRKQLPAYYLAPLILGESSNKHILKYIE
ncbi:hypothetical protein [Aureispira anguillae]|uniref:Uncharacterized protein n=1 Tax=Aureispira anguillae TaxID=2864201 RepID=A0A915YJL5_9BACT|nr:hypothetical protein [Aureispira anguillae]BDS14303.1 hypothetical protein AsAng_0050820 [Aureispira anguillae]